MDYERTRPPYPRKSTTPEHYNWASLSELDNLRLPRCSKFSPATPNKSRLAACPLSGALEHVPLLSTNTQASSKLYEFVSGLDGVVNFGASLVPDNFAETNWQDHHACQGCSWQGA
jgi:hypothetical protein